MQPTSTLSLSKSRFAEWQWWRRGRVAALRFQERAVGNDPYGGDNDVADGHYKGSPVKNAGGLGVNDRRNGELMLKIGWFHAVTRLSLLCRERRPARFFLNAKPHERGIHRKESVVAS